jgi:hypothetical protein
MIGLIRDVSRLISLIGKFLSVENSLLGTSVRVKQGKAGGSRKTEKGSNASS